MAVVAVTIIVVASVTALGMFRDRPPSTSEQAPGPVSPVPSADDDGASAVSAAPATMLVDIAALEGTVVMDRIGPESARDDLKVEEVAAVPASPTPNRDNTQSTNGWDIVVDAATADTGTLPSTKPSSNPSEGGSTSASTIAADGAPHEAVPCYGNYIRHREVHDPCVLARLNTIFEALFAGTHSERMAAVRDGHVLADIYSALEAYAREQNSDGYADPYDINYRPFEDSDVRSWYTVEVEGAVWNGPSLLGVLVRIAREDIDPVLEGWVAAPAVWVDGQWWVSYAGYCRLLSGMGDISRRCPPDPRPEIAAATGAEDSGSGAYDPIYASD